MAAELPTVETRRGRHVYCRASSDCVAAVRKAFGKPTGTGPIHVDDGELRMGTGSYCVIPPSKHPTGFGYKWIRPLNVAATPEIDLFESGFFSQLSISWTQTTQSIKGGALSCWNETQIDLPFSDFVSASIARTIPQRVGERNAKIFDFARALKAHPELTHLQTPQLLQFVRAWHSEALPTIGTKSLGETITDFARAWENVRQPTVSARRSDLLQAALDSPDDALAAEYGEPRGFAVLVAFCRAQQRSVGDQPFFLSCRDAGTLVGVGKSKANQWLKLLEAIGVLEVVRRGTDKGRRATEYMFRDPACTRSPPAFPL